MKNVLVKMGHFGKVMALAFFTKILMQNNEFLGHKNYCNRVES